MCVFLIYQCIVSLQACIMLLIANLEGVHNSWLSVLQWHNFAVSSNSEQWYCGIYWVITTVRMKKGGQMLKRAFLIRNQSQISGAPTNPNS